LKLFSFKNGELKRAADSPWPESPAQWLTKNPALYSDLLPERLLVFNDWHGQAGASGLLALDEEGSLVVLLPADQSPASEWIEEAAEFAWQLRHAEYGDLDEMSAAYFKKSGLAYEDLAQMHAGHFSLTEEKKPAQFNQNQRLLVLAPEFSNASLEKARWLRLEMDIEAFMLRFIDLESDGGLISVEKIDLAGGGRIASLVSLIAKAPSSRAETFLLNPKEDSEEPEHGGRAGSSIADRVTGLLARADSAIKTREYKALGILVLLYILTFSFLTVRHHSNFGTYGFDLGIFDQGIWLLSQFKEPFITVRGLHLFGDHLSLILILIAPLYWIWDDVRLLLVLQTIFLAAGAIPVFLIAKERLKNSLLSLALASSYLLYPALQWLNRDHFHPETIATPCLLFAFYFAMKRRYLPFAILAVLAALAKEDVSLILIMLGIYIAVTYNPRVGIATSILSLAYFAVGMRLVLPHFNEAGFFYINNYAHLGSTLGEIISNSLTNPGLVLSIILEERKLIYLLQLLAPIAFLPLVSIEVFLIALPALFSNLVSRQGYMDTIHFHYTATIIPFVYVASILAIEKFGLRQKGKLLAAGVIIVAAISTNYFLSPSPISQNFNQGYWNNTNERRGAIESALSSVPKDAGVSAAYYMVPHLTHREKIYEFPNPFITANWGIRGENPADEKTIEYVVVDFKLLTDEQRSLIEGLRGAEFEQIFNKEEIVVLKRK